MIFNLSFNIRAPAKRQAVFPDTLAVIVMEKLVWKNVNFLQTTKVNLGY